jgi:hypothetical protein
MAVSLFLPRIVFQSSLPLLTTMISIAQFPAFNFYDSAVDFLGAVSDLATFQSTFPGEGASLVAFKFAPQ